jgi:hypothetical protein
MAKTLMTLMREGRLDKGSKKQHTHTRIGNRETHISGGTYKMEANDNFYNAYHKHVFINNNKEYLVEKQNDLKQIVIDLDLRYELGIEEKQHCEDHIIDFIYSYLTTLYEEVLDIPNEEEIMVYVTEKNDIVKTDKLVKDGIHIIMGLKLDYKHQGVMRNKMIHELKTLWDDIPISNTWDDVYDDKVTSGSSNWMLYGSVKPLCQPYLIKYIYSFKKNEKTNEICVNKKDIKLFDNRDLISKLSVNYDGVKEYPFKEEYMKKVEEHKNKENIKKETSDKIYETLEKICDLIDVEHLDDRVKWLAIIYAMKKCNLSMEFAKLISSKSHKYKEDSFDIAWESYCDDQITSTEGTLRYYAKESNEKEYNELISWGRNVDKANKSYSNLLHYTNDYDFACLFVALIGDDLLYQPQTDSEDEKLYLYHDNQWKEDVKPHYLTRKIIFKVLSKYTIEKNIEYNKLLLTIDKEENEDEWEKIRKKISGGEQIMYELKKVNTKDTIVKAVKEELAGMENKIEFDKNPDLFSFNNKCFDLRTNEEHIPTKHDYILMRTGGDYKEPTQEQMEKIKGLVEQILPDEEVRKCYMSVLRSGMRGQTLEKFTMANGCGRNGKTFLHELFMHFMGKYAIKVNVSIITQKMKSGPNPELANLDKVRFGLFAEPEENQNIMISTMKDLTGGNTLTAKKCHSNKTEQINHGTYVMELNERVGFDGKLNLAVIERMLDVEFPSFFTHDPNQYNDPEFNNGHCYKRDDSLKEPKFKDEHACALFHYIMEYEGADELYVADAVKERTKAYLNSKDEFTSWFNSVYEVAMKKDENEKLIRDMSEPVKLKDAYSKYKDGDIYTNMSKKEKRKMTYARFVEIFSSHINFKHYYSSRTKITEIVKENNQEKEKEVFYRNVLRGFKEKDCLDNDDEEEDDE